MSLSKANSPMPLYYQLKQILEERIAQGEWSVGEQIPTEAELCKEYDVSRITVRHALSELERDGLIVRRQGVGTFVASPKIEPDLTRFYSFSEEFRKRGMQPRTEVLEFTVSDKEFEVCRTLNQPLESRVYRIVRLRYADDIVMAIEETYLPYQMFPGLTKELLQERAMYEVMRSDYNIYPTTAEESFGAILLTEEHARWFGLRAGDPGLDIVRKTFSHSTCIEYTRGVIRADKFRFHVKLE